MECVKMYYFIVFTLLTWAVTSSEAALSIDVKRIEPNPVLLGDNVTLSWTYLAGKDDILLIIYFHYDIVDEPSKAAKTRIASYITDTGKTGKFEDPPPHKYFDSVEWVGNITGNIAAFQMNNISNLAHDHTFGVEFYFGSSPSAVFDEIKIGISVPPMVNLRVTKTNVTVGDKVTIQCEVIQGRPAPNILWYLNDQILEQTGSYLINDKEIQQKDAGSYRCNATNIAGSSSSKVVTITVHKKSGDNGNGEPKSGKRESGLGAGAIVGIVLGILVIIVIVVVVAFVLIKRKGKPAQPLRSSNVNADDTQEAMVSDASKKDQVWL